MKTKHFTSTFAVLTLCFMLVACGGEQKSSQEAPSASPETTVTPEPTQTIDPDAPVVELTLRAVGNTMAEITFDQKELRVPAGTTVKLTLINESKDETMHHNFVLIVRGAAQKVADEGMKLGQAGNYLPTMDEVFAGTPMLGPGQSATITFSAPAEGEYQYICTYPGHFSVMNGRFFVD